MKEQALSHSTADTANPLGCAPVGSLIAKFAIPAIISMLVNALYNIVDQIFIGQGVGMLGNAATNIAFLSPRFQLLLPYSLESAAHPTTIWKWAPAMNARQVRLPEAHLPTLIVIGVSIAMGILLFLHGPLLIFFWSNRYCYAICHRLYQHYCCWTSVFTLSVGGNHLIRADRSPTYSMMCTLTGAVINTILDPLFIFGFKWGIKGRSLGNRHRSDDFRISGHTLFCKISQNVSGSQMLKPQMKLLKAIASLGLAACINQIAIAAVQIVMNNILRYYGSVSVYGSDIPIACVGIVSKVKYGLPVHLYRNLTGCTANLGL